MKPFPISSKSPRSLRSWCIWHPFSRSLSLEQAFSNATYVKDLNLRHSSFLTRRYRERAWWVWPCLTRSVMEASQWRLLNEDTSSCIWSMKMCTYAYIHYDQRKRNQMYISHILTLSLSLSQINTLSLPLCASWGSPAREAIHIHLCLYTTLTHVIPKPKVKKKKKTGLWVGVHVVQIIGNFSCMGTHTIRVTGNFFREAFRYTIGSPNFRV